MKAFLALCAAACLTVAGFTLAAFGSSKDSTGVVLTVSGYMKGYETVTWQPVAGVSGYALLRDGVGVSTAGPGATSTRFSLQPGQHILEVDPLFNTATTTTAPTTTVATTTAATTTTTTPAGMPLHGFSPGGQFAFISSTLRSWEENEYAVIGGGTPTLLRVDSESIIQELLNKGFDVSWVDGATIRGIANIPGGSIGSYCDGAAQFAARWKGVTGANGARVRMIEIGGNEPNINGISPADQVSILKNCYPKIKTADPSLQVSNAGLAPAPNGSNSLGPTYTPRDYVIGMSSNGFAAGQLDLFEMHLYEDAQARGTWNTWDQAFPTSPTGVRYGTFPAGTTVREQLDAHGMSNVPIWSGESGRSDSNATVMTHALQDFQQRRANGQRVGPMVIFTMRADWITVGTASGFGLTDLARNRNAAWSAVQQGIAAGG